MRLLEAEREQLEEEREALKITEEQLYQLKQPFLSVKFEFHDLDGLRWPAPSLYTQYLPSVAWPQVPTPAPEPTRVAPRAPPTRTPAKLTKSQLASFNTDDTIRIPNPTLFLQNENSNATEKGKSAKTISGSAKAGGTATRKLSRHPSILPRDSLFAEAAASLGFSPSRTIYSTAASSSSTKTSPSSTAAHTQTPIPSPLPSPTRTSTFPHSASSSPTPTSSIYGYTPSLPSKPFTTPSSSTPTSSIYGYTPSLPSKPLTTPSSSPMRELDMNLKSRLDVPRPKCSPRLFQNPSESQDTSYRVLGGSHELYHSPDIPYEEMMGQDGPWGAGEMSCPPSPCPTVVDAFRMSVH
ncbi:hypothetical protein DFP72DRAFT_363742 [Ephemerocybe angulata]|uniref:Uncharacterized protein n=1 Tax=Ephemerocybe angulata TaxID=980116 RepID=A0A8H6M6F9_9AGAR|nr:hypothetical protein DFP72DRAFT_363742 [Tulosesus angulatus]